MAKVFFTSDTHFNHVNIIKYCSRPFSSVEEMNREMIARWNSVVGPEDTVFHLGDFAMGYSTEWPSFLSQLNFKIFSTRRDYCLRVNPFGSPVDSSAAPIRG